MKYVIDIMLIIILMIIVYYDFKTMSIPVYILIAGLLVSGIRLFATLPVREGMYFAGMNLLICSVMLLLSFIILFIVRQKIFNPVDSMLGKGDLVFLILMCCCFSPVIFLFCFISSLFLMLLLKLVFFRSKRMFPLAGGISIVTAAFLIVSVAIQVNLYNDNVILNLLVR